MLRSNLSRGIFSGLLLALFLCPNSAQAQNLFDSLKQQFGQKFNSAVDQAVTKIKSRLGGPGQPGQPGQAASSGDRGYPTSSSGEYPVGGSNGEYPVGGSSSGNSGSSAGGYSESYADYPSSGYPTSGNSSSSSASSNSSSFGPRPAEPMESYTVGVSPSLEQLQQKAKTAPDPNVKKAPPGFPLPVYGDGRVVESFWNQDSAVVEFSTVESPVRLSEFYTQKIKQAGWYLNSGGMSNPHSSTLRAAKNGQKLTVFINHNARNDLRHVRMVMLFHPE